MIEYLSSLSLFFGFIFQTAAQIAVVMLALFGVIYFVEKKLPPSACHGDCNQGRNCDCKGK